MSIETALLLAFQTVIRQNEIKFKCVSEVPNPTNKVGTNCVVETCTRKAYAKNLCNAHYLRKRAGKDLAAPIERKIKGRSACKICEKQLDSRGGWGFCGQHYKITRAKLLKAAAIEVLGGCCSKCKQKYPTPVYDFHHVGHKTEGPSAALATKSLQKLAKELSLCLVLCANCHRLEHHGDVRNEC